MYVRDVDAGVTSRVSFNETAAGNRNEDSANPEFSGDGTKVVFTSEPGSDVPYDDDFSVDRDLYVGDLVTGTTELVTVSNDGTSGGNERTRHFAVNGDGTKIVFATRASNLVPNDSNGANDVFLRDTTAGTTALLSVNAAGTDSAAGNSANVSITPAGTGVVFTSNAGDLGPADTDGLNDVYVWPARLPSPVQFSSPHFGVVENSGPALVTLTRTGDVEESASVDLTTADGTATAPSDYTDTDTRVTFAPGVSIVTVTIPVANDATEGEETVLLSLSNPGGGHRLRHPRHRYPHHLRSRR